MTSLIILNFNRKDDVIYTLSNIYLTNKNNNEYEIILIDQNSNDGSQDAIKTEFPEVKIFCSLENLGVAGGRNKGAELASGDILVFLDDDAHFKNNNSIKIISDFFEQNANVGILGFKILDIKNNIRDWQYGTLSKKHKDKIFFTQQFVGCGHAIRADLFKKIKGYSADLFFWGEEIEFCLKTFRDSIFKIIYFPKIEIIHRVSPVSRFHWKNSRTEFKTRNRFALIYNYFPKNNIMFYIFFIYFLFGYFIRCIQHNSFKYFSNGFCNSFKMKLTNNKLSKNQIYLYSKYYIRQQIGFPILYDKNKL